MMIDLRSDTVTKPTPEMLKAMFNTKVGDDVFKEDPTILELEQKTADLFGMEAGLFCPSGTMTNQLAIKAHTLPGDELLCDATAHIYNYEVGGISFHSGVQAKLLPGKNGIITTEQIHHAINPDFDWLPPTKLVCIENTANRAGGTYYTLLQMQELSATCKKSKLKFHLDGARIFNALVELNVQPKELGPLFDSISVCLSKGLGAPVGSVLLGNKDWIKTCRRYRKLFGGGMRQAGYLAAAGIYALDNHVNRLKDDHQRAATLASVLEKLSFVESILPVKTNIVIFNLKQEVNPVTFVDLLKQKGIIISAFGHQAVRLVTHLDFTDDMLANVIMALKDIEAEMK